MHEGASTSVSTQDGVTDGFPITIGLHQGSNLSPYISNLVLYVLTEHIQELALICMLCAQDESREELNERSETLRQALKARDICLSRSKTMYMKCNFSKRRSSSTLEVKVRDHIIPQVTPLKYLGSIVQSDGEIEAYVNHRIQSVWLKWKRALGSYAVRKYRSS